MSRRHYIDSYVSLAITNVPTRVMGGGEEQQATCLVVKQAVESPQVLASIYYYICVPLL